MKNVLDHTSPIQRHFEEMTRIPHGSYNEKQYSDYLVEFAKKHNLAYKQYEIGNVIIYKDATEGYEDHGTVILQAHMDMVCAKVSGCTHDFFKDSLDLYIEDGYLRARGTTLGADNGTGVAYMLAVLESDTISHPALECVFTVQEEVGMYGARQIKVEDLKGRRFLSLDDGGAISTTTTSAGGMRITLTRPVETEEVELPVYELSISGLFGGHSGEGIGKERGNANKMMARILYELNKSLGIRLISMEGGDKENAIPRECRARLGFDGDEKVLQAALEETFKALKEELRYSDTGAELKTESVGTSRVQAFTGAYAEKLLELLYLLPTGLRHTNMRLQIPEASENLAIVGIEDGVFHIKYSLRSAAESRLDQMAEEIRLLAGLFGFGYEDGARYPGWPYREDSFMREKLGEAFKAVTGEELQLKAVHGGLECGFFAALSPDMDIITFGPRGLDVHTPNENLDLKSFEDCFVIFKELLKRL